jgi:hypothetical protein
LFANILKKFFQIWNSVKFLNYTYFFQSSIMTPSLF